MTGNDDLVRFPPCSAADPDGLLMVGGELTPSWVLSAYRQGVFPWPLVDGEREVLAWFAPWERAILPLDSLRLSRRVQRRIRRDQFSISYDTTFASVVQNCAAPRRRACETWITRSLAAAYERLHEIGHAHSVEVWCEQELVGGVFGVSVAGMFSAESMFHRRTDASKVALYYLVERLRSRGFQLLDIQQLSPHMAGMGAVEISSQQYLRRLQAALRLQPTFGENRL